MKTSGAGGARGKALDAISAVTRDGKLLSDVLPAIVAPLGAADRARAGRLATGTLRWAQRSDRLLGRYLRQKPPDDILNILRLATYELHVAAEAPHGVVSSMVTLARARSGEPGLSRLVNAVLRKVAAADDWAALPPPELPKTLRKPLVRAYGKDRVAAIEAVHAAEPPLDLTAKSDPRRLAEALGGVVLPTGSVRLSKTAQVSGLPGFDAGDWWVQDAASALPARVLDPGHGETVADLCAAPGGKTMQLAAAGASVTALDISAPRLSILRENLARTGLAARVVEADLLTWSDGPFDAVLLDAPCSATGTIRRHPDLPHAKRDLDLAPLLDLQARLLDRARAVLRPGGRLVFCTCSLFPEEGEAQIAAALDRWADLAVEPIGPNELPGLDPRWITPEGNLRLTPETWADTGGIDGFFIARVVRAQAATAADDSARQTG